ncbi:hypothetical protein [Tolypothrix sp. FACHB-123]|nr:hypothetical protein [Tolypothrix sp. FACHB-123]
MQRSCTLHVPDAQCPTPNPPEIAACARERPASELGKNRKP